MFQIIRQFTFHRPKEIIQPTVWLFLSQACSMLPAILAYMAIYTLGQAFVPPYTLDLQFLITLAAIGLGYILLQYAIELVSYYFTYGRAYSDTAKKRVAYIQKLRRQPLGFFSSKESGELISSFANDFSNVEYTLCYWLPYPIGVGALLAISIVWICLYDWRMGVAMFGMLPVCAALMFGIARIKEKHSRQVMEAKTHAATQINEYLHGMKDLKAYHRTGDGFHALETAMRKLRDESLKEEAVAGSLSTLCSTLVKFIVPVTAAVGLLSADRGHTVCFRFCRLSRFSDQTGRSGVDGCHQHIRVARDASFRRAVRQGDDNRRSDGGTTDRNRKFLLL